MTTVGYATTDLGAFGEVDPDQQLLRDALAQRGIHLVAGRWRDVDAPWAECDLVLMRSVWDYHHHLEEFLVWLSALEEVTRVANPAEVIRWNLDKAYLGRLAERGVPVVPTSYCSTSADVDAALGSSTGTGVVVKPTISAGSRDTGLFPTGDPGAAVLARSILDRGATVMIQPAIDSVGTEGEVGVVCIGERPAHWLSKGPILRSGGGFREGRYTERITRIDPPRGARDTASLVLEAVGDLRVDMGIAEPLIYARLDLVRLDDGAHALLEAELFEPCLFLDHAPRSVDVVADAVAERAGRIGHAAS